MSFIACDALTFFDEILPDSSVDLQATVSEEPESADTVSATTIPTQVPLDQDVITAWVQPIFDPEGDIPGADALKRHIENYRSQNPGVKIKFRLKEAEGSNSILNALSITAAAAPDALPTIVLLSRQDMEQAASLGLIRPIEFFANAFENNDWYPFAVKMGIYNNELFGLPFAADVMVLSTTTAINDPEYISLSTQSNPLGKIGFTAGNSESLVPYLWYQSAGGKIPEDPEQPLDEAALTSVFSAIADNRRSGTFSSSLVQYVTQDDVWKAFMNGNLDSMITWTSSVLSKPNDHALTYIPAIGSAPYTYADGWVWCLVQKDTTDIDRNVDFMQYMVTPDFLQEWTPHTNFLPIRPSTTDYMELDQSFVNELLLSADIIPTGTIRDTIELVLTEEIKALLRGENSADVGVQNVLSRLEEEQQSD